MAEGDVTVLLAAAREGDAKAQEALLPLVYDELRRRAGLIMRRERANHTLQPTALVHEAYLDLVRQDRSTWNDRAHFFAIAAQMMRRILVDHARTRGRKKRGDGAVHEPYDPEITLSPQKDEHVLAVDEALEKLAALDPRQADIVVMRFFGGSTVDEVATALGMSKRAVEAEWTMAKAWLRRTLSTE